MAKTYDQVWYDTPAAERADAAESARSTAYAEGLKAGHCKDCCCARAWEALGVTTYTGMSIPEHITQLRDEVTKARAEGLEEGRRAIKAIPEWGGDGDEPCRWCGGLPPALYDHLKPAAAKCRQDGRGDGYIGVRGHLPECIRQRALGIAVPRCAHVWAPLHAEYPESRVCVTCGLPEDRAADGKEVGR
jgi:hypothetical protein